MSSIKMDNPTDFINRIYKTCDNLQWIREILVNSIESKATRVDFGVEWGGVEKFGVYRRIISDDGLGMSSDHLHEYFSTIGRSGKKINKGSMNEMDFSVHGNFGIGCRVSLLPWNREGLVYISYQGGKGSMIWMLYNQETGEYYIKEWIDPDSGDVTEVIDPDNFSWGEDDIDWSKVAPEWIKDHGTCVILMGNNPQDHTILSNTDTTRIIAKYINTRFWELPDINVTVSEFNFKESSHWPRTRDEFHSRIDGKENSARGTTRTCHGAKYYIREVSHYDKYESSDKGKLKSEGDLLLAGGKLRVNWYLWEGRRPQISSYASEQGYIAVRYKNELFGLTNQIPQFRNYGICEKEVKNNVTIILEPKHSMEDETWGVFPDSNRTRLVFTGYGDKNIDLPLSVWGEDFCKNMPTEIKDAIREVHNDMVCEDLSNEDRVQKLLERIGNRFSSCVFVEDPFKSSKKMGQTDPLSEALPIAAALGASGSSFKFGDNGEAIIIKKPVKGGKEKDKDKTVLEDTAHKGNSSKMSDRGDFAVGGNRVLQKLGAKKAVKDTSGTVPISKVKPMLDIPKVSMGKIEDFDNPNHICAYIQQDPLTGKPKVLLNGEAPVLVEAIKYHQGRYHESHQEVIKFEVLGCYASIAACRVAHTLKFVRALKVPKEEALKSYLSEEALSVGLLGLIDADAFISPRLGKIGIKA